MQLSVGQAMEVQHCLSRGNWASEELKRVCQGDLLSHKVLSVLRGDAEIVPVVRMIDGDCNPDVGPDAANDEVVRHVPFGFHHWSDLTIDIYKPERTEYPSQRVGKKERDFVKFNEEEQLPQCLIGKSLANKNLRDYYLLHPHLIPEKWQMATWHMSGSRDRLLFWGTILKRGNSISNRLVIPGLIYTGDRWRASDCDLEEAKSWPHNSFAVLVSPTA